jgi:hypothetical protein
VALVATPEGFFEAYWHEEDGGEWWEVHAVLIGEDLTVDDNGVQRNLSSLHRTVAFTNPLVRTAPWQGEWWKR